MRLDLLHPLLLEDLDWNVVMEEESAEMRFYGDIGVQVLRFRQVNVNSLLNKMDYVSIFAKDCNLAVVAVSESWLLESIPSSFATIEEYNIIRGDVYEMIRKHGACLFIRSNLKCVET